LDSFRKIVLGIFADTKSGREKRSSGRNGAKRGKSPIQKGYMQSKKKKGKFPQSRKTELADGPKKKKVFGSKEKKEMRGREESFRTKEDAPTKEESQNPKFRIQK